MREIVSLETCNTVIFFYGFIEKYYISAKKYCTSHVELFYTRLILVFLNVRPRRFIRDLWLEMPTHRCNSKMVTKSEHDGQGYVSWIA